VSFHNTHFEGPVALVEVQAAVFNSPELPQQLTPNHIGVLPGTVVYGDDLFEPAVWDGRQVLETPIALHQQIDERHDGSVPTPEEQQAAMVEARLAKEAQEERFASGVSAPYIELIAAPPREAYVHRPRRPPTLQQMWADRWERYVRQFTTRYMLDAGQTDAAQRILRDCQELARQHFRAKRAEFEQVAAELDRARNATERLHLAKRRDQLLERLEDLFANQLCPRLDRLLTASQRGAPLAPASAPAP
jgi:hypothetical protein